MGLDGSTLGETYKDVEYPWLPQENDQPSLNLRGPWLP